MTRHCIGVSFGTITKHLHAAVLLTWKMFKNNSEEWLGNGCCSVVGCSPPKTQEGHVPYLQHCHYIIVVLVAGTGAGAGGRLAIIKALKQSIFRRRQDS